jgi:hypothetical protein
MIRLFAAAAFTLVLIAPGAAQEPPPKPPAPVDRTAEFQRAVTEERGLKFTQKVTVGEYTRDELLAFIRKELDREMPKEDAEKVRVALVHFGLISPELDFYQTIIDLLGSSIAGFYHPKTKELRLIKSGEGEEEPQLFRDITLVHELCHAAQDQNFELNTLPLELKTNDDVVLAVQALVEGDATVVGLKWGLKDEYDMMAKLMIASYKAGELGPAVSKVPAYLRKSLAYPYGYGTEFVQALLSRSKDDWTAVSKAFGDLPGSTEQILHPSKYFGEVRDHPQDVTVDGLEGILADGWKLTYHNVFGEFGTRLLLDEFKVENAKARRLAAEGWDGDRYFIFNNGKGNAGVWMTVWDGEEDAKEFYAAYALVLEAKHEGAEKTTADQMISYSNNGVAAVIERRGADVLILDGFGSGPAGRANKVWSAVKKTEVKKVDRVAPKVPPKDPPKESK